LISYRNKKTARKWGKRLRKGKVEERGIKKGGVLVSVLLKKKRMVQPP